MYFKLKYTSAQAAVFFPPKLCVIQGGNKNMFYKQTIKKSVVFFVLFLSKLIVQVPLKQVCVKLLLRYLMIITEGLIFAGFHVTKGFIHVVLRFLYSYLSLMWHTHI